jgi:regulator of cell morphogenesis and NO signaling
MSVRHCRAFRFICRYEVPADGRTTYAVCMAELEHFERDLHRHVHLENNVLFPRVVELESRQSDD